MIVYTAIFNDYDRLRNPPRAPNGTEFVCYTDNLTPPADGWKLRRVTCAQDPRRCSRYYKIMSTTYFPNANVTIWHGGNVKLKGNLSKLAGLVEDADVAVLRHSERDCAYKEAEACIRWCLDNKDVIVNQIERYRREGYPPRRGLSACFLLVRRNTQRTRWLEEVWWNEIKQGSVRDQISFDYACWKTGVKPVAIPGDIFKGPYHRRNGLHG